MASTGVQVSRGTRREAQAKCREWAGRGYRFVLALALAGVVVFERGISWGWWSLPGRRALLLVLFVLVFAAIRDNVKNLVDRTRATKKQKRQEDAEKAAVGAMIEISELTKVPVGDLGVSVYKIRKGWLSPDYLDRVIRYRISHYPPPSNVDWTKGKGAIGYCWETKQPAYRNRNSVARRFVGAPPDDQQWSSMTEKDRGGFDREDFAEVVHKYCEVAAVPIIDEGGIIRGVLALDRMRDASGAAFKRALHRPDVTDILTRAAQLALPRVR